MTAQHWMQIATAIVAAAAPWLVVRITFAVARQQARSVGLPLSPPATLARLDRATAAVVLTVSAAALWLPPASLFMAALDAASFIGLSIIAMRALGTIHAASRSIREVDQAERTAGLRPRRIGQYLPLAPRIAAYAAAVAGVALLAWRLSTSSFERPLVPVAFILFAPVFLWLYEIWIRNEVSAGHLAVSGDGEDRRGRRVRTIFGVELLLVVGCAALGHTLLSLDWFAQGLWVAAAVFAGAALGVFGCALALSSELGRRQYRIADGDRSE